MSLQLPKYSLGVGDRFGCEAAAQLAALRRAHQQGVAVTPVWNKSFREHSIIHTTPDAVRAAAAAAVAALGWTEPYFVDADHITLKTVDGFLAASDFFTLDVAGAIGTAAEPAACEAFLRRHADLCGVVEAPGLPEPLRIDRDLMAATAARYVFAVQEAGRIYRRIEHAKGAGAFITEVSMDETPGPQAPAELLLILAMLADEGVPAQTIAPRFSGRFNKGVDYVGEVARFEREFAADAAVVRLASGRFGLPANLKLSVHSGSDKFSLYGPMARVMRAQEVGVHLKTAGTTWLEELIGLAEGGGEGLAIAREVYAAAVRRFDELCGPYAEVLAIERSALPAAATVAAWDGARFAAALRHDPACPQYDPNVRQLLHVAYKVAVELGRRFTEALAAQRAVVARNVEHNLYARHLQPLFSRAQGAERAAPPRPPSERDFVLRAGRDWR